MQRRTVVTEGPLVAVETSMFRPLAVLRVILLVNALALFVYRGLTVGERPWSNTDHLAAAVLVMVVLAVWTGVAGWAYRVPSRRRMTLLVVDLLIAVGAILVSPLVKGEPVGATLPGFWVVGAVLAWAVHWRALGGMVAAAAVALADLSVRSEVGTVQYGNLFLLTIGGLVVGYTAGLLKDMAAARDEAQRAAAEAHERAQLARAVHDGVLQVLALVQRRGRELGGEAAELGRMAGDQEAALRALLQQGARPPRAGAEDLAAALTGLQSRQVTVSVPGRPVTLPAATTREVVAVVQACLDNVRRHVGADAPAWVALEDRGDEVVVSVRDDGPGIPAGRLEEARADGRLGVSESVVGRVRDLGGTAELLTSPTSGTEWEITLPRA